MKLTDDVHIVAGGKKGLGMTDKLDCTVYLLDAGSEQILIDTGASRDVDALLENVRRCGLDPSKISGILLTHAHADHAAGAAALRKELGARVYLSSAEATLLENADEDGLALTFAREAGVYPPDYRLPACPIDVRLDHNDEIAAGSLRLRAIAVRGHSTGSICYLVQGREGRYLFSGDTVFCGGRICLLNCTGSSLSQYKEDIGRLSGLGVDALFPGHLAFCLRGGQEYLDRACDNFRGIFPPPNIG